MKDKVQKIREEVERLQNELIQEKEKGFGSDTDDACILELQNVLTYIDSLQEETESIWHDANQQPTMYRKYIVRYSDGSVSGSWERHDDGFISWEDEAKEHGSFTHWCYVKDLLKL